MATIDTHDTDLARAKLEGITADFEACSGERKRRMAIMRKRLKGVGNAR